METFQNALYGAFAALMIMAELSVPIGGLLYGMFWLAETSCEKQARKAGVEWDFAVMQGCMVKINGPWVPLRNWRVL